MKKTVFYLLVTALLILGLSPASQAIDKLGQTGMPFLKIDVGGRASAMGSASAAVTDDATSMFSNLAGLAFVDGFEVAMNQTNWIADIKHYAGGVAYGFKNWGTFGVSLIYMDYGTMTETRPYDGSDPILRNQGYEDLGDFEVGEYAVGLSYGRRISNQFSIGAQIKMVKQDLYESLILHEVYGETVVQNEQTVNAFDFGTLYYTGWKDLRVAMSIRNFSRQGRYVFERFELPLMFNIGMAMDVMTLFADSDMHKLTVAVDAIHPRDYSERIHLGAEYGMSNMLFLRGGYKFNYDEEGLTFGVGVNKPLGNYGVKFDYSYGDFGEFFGSVHRISWSIYMK